MGRATENNRHSMASTWTTSNPDSFNSLQRIIHKIDMYPLIPGKPPPVVPKTAPVPVLSDLSMHAWIVVHLLLPLVIHQAWATLTGTNLPSVAVFVLYTVSFIIIMGEQAQSVRQLMYQHGCLDGDHSRDDIPDTGVGKILGGISKVTSFRIAAAAFGVYNRSQTPLDAMSDATWWLTLVGKLSLYGVFIDLYFYVYHRACHEVPALWKYHRTHHLTKHPTILLTGFADDEQEIMEMILVPLAAYFSLGAIGLPLGFYDWWICFQYLMFTEMMGHTGLRLRMIPPSPISWLLKALDMELIIEDHDLHHRRGWKKAANYGKQTRIFDKVFGTTAQREEMIESNVDHSKVVYMPFRTASS